MAVFNDIVIRCELYPDRVSAGEKFTNVATGIVPGFYKGAQFELQIAIFKTKSDANTGAELYDISQFSGVPKFRVRTTNASGTILIDDTVSGVTIEKDITLDLASWQDGSKWHFRIYVPETASSVATGTNFIVIYGPDSDVFGISDIVVIDPGTGASASPSPPTDVYPTKTDLNNKLLDYLPKQLSVNQPFSYLAKNPDTGQIARITDQPLWDGQGPRIVRTITDITPP